MPKLPFIKWFPGDWMADTAMLSPATRGIWFDLLNVMWQLDHADKLSGTVAELARAGRCDVAQMQTAIDELARFRVANIGERDGVVTVICRRFKRDNAERLRAKNGMRVTRQLQKKEGSVTREKSDIRISNTLAGVTAGAGAPAQENPPAQKFYPQSIDEVLEMAADPRCAVVMSRDQAEAYFLARDSVDWIDAAGRRIPPGKVYGDIRRWVLNDRKKATSGGEEIPAFELSDSMRNEG